MCQNQMGQAVGSNPNFRNPGFYANPNVQQQIVTQARGRYFDPNALNAAGNPLPPPPTVPPPNIPTTVPTSNGPTTATGLPSLASLMQRAGGANVLAQLPTDVQNRVNNTTIPAKSNG